MIGGVIEKREIGTPVWEEKRERENYQCSKKGVEKKIRQQMSQACRMRRSSARNLYIPQDCTSAQRENGPGRAP